MRVELLNSSIPPSDRQFLVTFLVDEELAIDAGALGLLADLRRRDLRNEIAGMRSGMPDPETLAAQEGVRTLRRRLAATRQ